nr:hypothetical protein [uncultured Blautia sp.]
MTYYVRKISRSKWQKDPLSEDQKIALDEIKGVRADAITNCIKTTGDKLSLWKVENKKDCIDDIVPLIVGFERPDTCDVIYIEESIFEKEGIKLEQSMEDANTPIEALKPLHYNAVVNDYDGLGKFAKIILMSLGNHKRFKGREVKSKLKEMMQNNEISKDMISEKLYEKIS